jgi:hypothetical protein
MIFGIIVGLNALWTQGDPELNGFAKGLSVIAIWILFFLIQMVLKLRYIETTDKGVLIKNLGRQKLVEYRDILWITKFDITNPWFLTLKYHDRVSGIDKKISFMPDYKDQSFFSNDGLTRYLKDKIKSDNPNYSKGREPSIVKNFIFLIILGLPFMLIALYFMRDMINIT